MMQKSYSEDVSLNNSQLTQRKEYSMLVNSIPMPSWLQEKEKADFQKVFPGDELKLHYVIQIAEENVQHGTGGPFAAAIFDMKSDRLIAIGINVVVPARQSCAHAEMTAFSHAQNLMNTYSLRGCLLVTSCEPCAMCSGATPWSGVEKMIYGATREMAESVGFDEGYKGQNWREEFEKRGICVVGPLLAEEAQKPFELYKGKQGIIYG